MSQSFIFYRGSWIYLRKSELLIMKEIINILKRRKSISTYNLLYSMEKICHKDSVRRGLCNLMNARIVKVQQHADARIYLLVDTWEEKLEKALEPFIK